MSSAFSIAILSDLHIVDDLSTEKSLMINKICTSASKRNIVACICAGDLTNRRRKDDFQGLVNNTKQIRNVKRLLVNPLESAGVKVVLGPGNHDLYRDKYMFRPVIQYIRQRHKCDRTFCYKLSRWGLDILCLGVYPSKKCLRWLRQNMHRTKPTILFYHYNTKPEEPFSNWWKQTEKDNFYSVIKEYNNIIAIVNGHVHHSSIKKWKGFTMLNGGGSKVPLIKWNPDTMSATFSFLR